MVFVILLCPVRLVKRKVGTEQDLVTTANMLWGVGRHLAGFLASTHQMPTAPLHMEQPQMSSDFAKWRLWVKPPWLRTPDLQAISQSG